MRQMGVITGVIVVACCAPSARADGVALRMGTLAAEGSRYGKDIAAMSREIEQRTDGKVKLEWYYDGRRGDDVEMAAKLVAGELHGGAFSDVGLTELVPAMRALQVPGMFRDYAEVDRVTAALHDHVRDLFADRKVVFAMWADLGFSHVFSRSKITHVDQLPDDIVASGALPTGDEAAWALPPLYALASGSHVHADYVWGLPYRYVTGGLVFAEFAWNALTEQQQQVVTEVCREWEPKARERWRAETVDGLNALKKKSITLVKASDAETAVFFEQAAAQRDGYAAKWKVEDLMTRLSVALEATR